MWGQPRGKCINFMPFSTSFHGFPRRAIEEVDTDSESSWCEEFEFLCLNWFFELGARFISLGARALFAQKLKSSRKYNNILRQVSDIHWGVRFIHYYCPYINYGHARKYFSYNKLDLNFISLYCNLLEAHRPKVFLCWCQSPLVSDKSFQLSSPHFLKSCCKLTLTMVAAGPFSFGWFLMLSICSTGYLQQLGGWLEFL